MGSQTKILHKDQNDAGQGGAEAPSPEACCSLDCLERPNYFCGQLLSDADLSALLAWARAKFRLEHQRHGWGAVCGLELYCDPERPGHVLLAPGYAVSPCGHDIVVCEEADWDMAQCWPVEPADPCADPYAAANETPTEEKRPVCFGEQEIDADEIRTFDLCIRYDEKATAPQPALGRSACLDTARCEFSRVRETYALHCEPAAENDPARIESEQWVRSFNETLDVLSDFQRRFPNPSRQAQKIRLWFQDRFEEQPLEEFCHLRDKICRLSDDEIEDKTELVKLLFDLVQDRRNAQLNSRCAETDTAKGVPLARVWVSSKSVKRKRQLKVLAIDNDPPHRRPFQPDDLPAPFAHMNLADITWRRREEACALLDRRGLQLLDQEPLVLGDNIEELKRKLTWDPVARCGEGIQVIYHDAGPLGQRIVALRGAGAGIWVDVDPDRTVVRPGSKVTFISQVVNNATKPITLLVKSKLNGGALSTLADGGCLLPGERRYFTEEVEIPLGRTSDLVYEAEALDKTPDSAIEPARDSATVQVRENGEALIEVRKTLVRGRAVPGETVFYRIEVENNDKSGVTVRLVDEKLGIRDEIFRLDTARQRTWSKDYPYLVPPGAGDRIVNEARVVGETDDCRLISATAVHELQIHPAGFWAWLCGWTHRQPTLAPLAQRVERILFQRSGAAPTASKEGQTEEGGGEAPPPERKT